MDQWGSRPLIVGATFPYVFSKHGEDPFVMRFYGPLAENCRVRRSICSRETMRTTSGQTWLTGRATVLGGLVLLVLSCRTTLERPAPIRNTTPTVGAQREPLQQHAADLAVCNGDRGVIAGTEKIDIRDLANRLHGSWVLDERTIQGLVIDTNTVFKFDFDHIGRSAGEATALLIDQGNLSVQDPLRRSAACQADATVAALWKVSVRLERADKALLVMDGEYYGSYGEFLEGIRFREQLEFVKSGENYYSGKLVTPGGGFGIADDVWDLVSLTEHRLTYISCKNRVVENYVKVDTSKPTLDGRSLLAAWEQRKRDGTVTVPIPVEPSWKRQAGAARR